MKKIGIITIYDLNNFGNRLQNYALQEFLEQNDFDVVSFKNRPGTNKMPPNWHSYIIQCVISFLKLRSIHEFYLFRKRGLRYKKFVEFNKRFIKSSKKYITFYNAKMMSKNFDYFVVGSDQVWNPKLNRLSYIDLLSFFKSSGRIAISPSIGTSNVQGYVDLHLIKKELEKFKFLSTREEQGSKVLNEILGRNIVKTLVDPTLLLNVEKWNKLEQTSTIVFKKKYVLLYFLRRHDQKEIKQIMRFAKVNNLTIVNLMDKGSKYYNFGPNDFLHSIKNAEYVFTDSFHGTVFSIIFKKKFLVFKRKDKDDMYFRITNLLNLLDIKNVEYKDQTICISTNDYNVINKKLDDIRKRNINLILEQFNQ